MIVIGIDDTDNKESRGTGHLARMIAQMLEDEFQVLGITRHQLLFDPRVPYTAKNSCAAILLEQKSSQLLNDLFFRVKNFMLEDFQPGSDPGLCIADHIPNEVINFGLKAKRDLVNQDEARSLAKKNNILLEGLGGTQDGVIGALSAVALAFSGNDGRYVQIGHIRDLSGCQSIQTILETGISSIKTISGETISDGLVYSDKLRPARRDHQAVLFVEPGESSWLPLKLD